MTAYSDDAIAIIGFACRLPGAPDARGYWAMLRSGTEAITRFDDGQDPDFVPARGVFAGSHDFDWRFFGYSRAEAASIDPQQRVFLECASAAVDHAAIDPARFPGWIGVYAGADKVTPRPHAALSELAGALGEEKDFLASRVAYKLGLRGPAITVQTACSTSLAAVHLAAAALRARECDAALAGGVTVMPREERGYRYEHGGVLSPDGHCRPFDARAGGTVPSEGVGVVVLKRAADALRDGDAIAALILGSAINNDGDGKIGYTAPSVDGQSSVIRRAQQVAGVDPGDITYVEAHGTATRLGDPIEVAALTDAFGTSARTGGPCWIGAVKSNIGHTGAAAGVAGLIKTVLMLEHRELVPTLHFTTPNPLLDLDSTPFLVCAQAGHWPGSAIAAVSSFGLGGANAHAIVAAPPRASRGGAPLAAPTTASAPAPSGPRLLVLSAASVGALERTREALVGELEDHPALTLPEVAGTLAARRRFAHRAAVVADDLPEAAWVLREGARALGAEAPSDAPGRDTPGPGGSLDRVAFLFPGQGALRGGAGVAAYRLLPRFRECFDEVREVIYGSRGVDLSPVVAGAEAPPGWFLDTVHQQLGLFALGCGLGHQLRDWGITPAVMLGNSIGEFAAATLAGLWPLADAARLVYQRASAMWDTKPGRMATISAPAGEVSKRLPADGGVAVAVSASGTTVIAGALADMDRLLASGDLSGLEVRLLEVERAFHSASMEAAADVVRAAVAKVPPRHLGQGPGPRIVSCMTGEVATAELLCAPDYWSRHLRNPVLLDAAADAVLATGCDTFLELGPGSSMIASLRRATGWSSANAALPMLGRAGNEERGLLCALGNLWELGIDAVADVAPWAATHCALPPHPMDSADPDDGLPRPAGPRTDWARPGLAPAALSGSGAAARPPAGERRRVLEELWCAALGVTSVRVTDDFFTLGGESLTAVDLLSRLRQATGLALSVTDFSRAPTFGALVSLAEHVAGEDTVGPAATVRAVALHDDGPGSGSESPVFLAADATGNALSYLPLAGLLAGSRRVYGLELADVDMSNLPIEDSATLHVDALLRVQEAGPYILGGWSFGAVLAHEMAFQLAVRGERTAILVCLDGHPPATSPPPFDPGYLWLQASAMLGIGAAGQAARRNPGLRAMLAAKYRLLSRYRPRPVDCPAVVFKVGSGKREAASLTRRLAPLYGGGVRVVPASGDHWSMLTPPHVQGLARVVHDALPVAASDLTHPAQEIGTDSVQRFPGRGAASRRARVPARTRALARVGVPASVRAPA